MLYNNTHNMILLQKSTKLFSLCSSLPFHLLKHIDETQPKDDSVGETQKNCSANNVSLQRFIPHVSPWCKYFHQTTNRLQQMTLAFESSLCIVWKFFISNPAEFKHTFVLFRPRRILTVRICVSSDPILLSCSGHTWALRHKDNL